MSHPCPECGAAAGFEDGTARVLHGTCEGCGKTFTILQDVSLPIASAPAVAPGEPSSGSAVGPPCGECGGALVLKSISATSFEVSCPSCETRHVYVRETESFRRPPREPARPARPRSGDRPFFAPPNARPCRECGGVLQFSTGEDGTISGECTSCGNRFNLPPRRDGPDRRGGYGDRRGAGRSFRPPGRGPPSWQGRRDGGGPRSFSNRPTRFRRVERSDDGDSDDRPDWRRRRPRRD